MRLGGDRIADEGAGAPGAPLVQRALEVELATGVDASALFEMALALRLVAGRDLYETRERRARCGVRRKRALVQGLYGAIVRERGVPAADEPVEQGAVRVRDRRRCRTGVEQRVEQARRFVEPPRAQQRETERAG